MSVGALFESWRSYTLWTDPPGEASALYVTNYSLALSEVAAALPQDNALLAWLSAPRFRESLLAEDISSSQHFNGDLQRVDGSNSTSVDEFFAGLATRIDF